jgi:hypothetical protein
MIRQWSLAVLVTLAPAGAVLAQPASVRFHWQPGQELVYRVQQVTSATEVVEGKTTQTSSKLANVKRWQVLDVDAAGVATLRLSLQSLSIATTTPGGDVLEFDSANPQVGTPQMREQLSKFVGPPLAVLRINSQGKVVEVKESKFGPASRYESDPPFVLTLPEGGFRESWLRSYKITLEPPNGTGEKYDASQKYTAQAGNNGTITVNLTTVLQSQPEAVADRIPLLQCVPEGQAVFNMQTGMLESARLTIDKELKGHQGEGSSYRFQSTYVEQYVGGK